jgi:hypothetical protein
MHPLILQQLVTDRVNDMIATAAGSRRAREARRTGRVRTSGRRAQASLRRAGIDVTKTDHDRVGSASVR